MYTTIRPELRHVRKAWHGTHAFSLPNAHADKRKVLSREEREVAVMALLAGGGGLVNDSHVSVVFLFYREDRRKGEVGNQ
jgi:hypothetical protein